MASRSGALLRRLTSVAAGTGGLAVRLGSGSTTSSACVRSARAIASLASAALTLPSPSRTVSGNDSLHAAALRVHGPGGVRVPGVQLGAAWLPPPSLDHRRPRPPGPPLPPARARPALPTTTWAQAGWTATAVLTFPNFLSFARLLSAPLLAHWIIAGNWPAAAAGLTAAAVSDWADGAAARSLQGQGSVLGTYLDPIADKAVVCAVAGALAHVGALPPPLAALVIGRDGALVAGALAGRLAACDWAWPGGPEFFRLVPGVDAGGSGGAGGGRRRGGPPRPQPAPPAPPVRPLLLSKCNTALQFGLAGAAIGTAWQGWPGAGVVEGLAWAVGAATLGSGGQYAAAALKGAARG